MNRERTLISTKLARLLIAFGALALLAAVLVGPPVALVLWGDWPLTGLPSEEQIGDLPTSLATEGALFGAMTLAAGVIWLLFLVSAAIETIAELRNEHLADVPLARPIQTFVRKLVAAALLSVSATGAPVGAPRTAQRRPVGALGAPASGPAGAGAGPRPALPAASSHTSIGYQPGPPRPPTQDMRTVLPHTDSSVRGRQAAPSDPTGATGSTGLAESGNRLGTGTAGGNGRSVPLSPSGPPSTGAGRTIVVGDLDTPWSLAEKHLGDGMAWRELFEANRARAQPDGRSWTDPEVLEPGWKLVLPVPAADHASGPPSSAGSSPDPTETLDPHQPTSSSPNPPDPTETLDPHQPTSSSPNPSDPTETLDPHQPTSSSPNPSDRGTQPPTRGAFPLVGGQSHAADEGPLPEASWSAEALRIDAVSRALTDDLAYSAPADIVGLRTSSGSIDVLLATPAAPPVGFETGAADATLWRADTSGSVPPPEQRARRNVPLLPALVSFGQTTEGTLLFDIERLGALSVEGDPQQVWAWLRGVAEEIASSPWSRDVALRVAGLPGVDPTRLVGASDIQVADSLAELGNEAATFTMATSTALEQQSTQAARAAGGGPWSPMVIVTGAAVPTELVSQCRFGGGGLAVVVAGPLPQARWRFEIDASGQAVLHPWGVRCSVSSTM